MGTLQVMQTFGVPRPTTNPYIVQLARALEADPRVDHVPFSWRSALFAPLDVVHVHWADALLAGRNPMTRFGKRVAMALFIARIRLGRIPVVRTVHNLTPPDGDRMSAWLVRELQRCTTLRIHLSTTTPQDPTTPSVCIVHGHYEDWFSSFPEERVTPGRIGYVGLLKAYKGIMQLLTAFEDATTPGLSLSLAGRPADDDTRATINARITEIPGADATLRYVSEAELVERITSSELVVLPYLQMHNSGAVLAALSLHRPVLVPANPTNAALAAEVGQSWVHQFDGELTGAALDAVIARLRRGAASSPPDLSARGWSETGRLHADAYATASDIRRSKGRR